MRALSLARSAEAGAARDFLLKQQCASGYFRLNFDKADVPSQSCAEGVAGSEADPDATALAVINLIESGDKSPAVTGRPRQGRHLAGRPPARQRRDPRRHRHGASSTPTPPRSAATPSAC